MNISLLIFGFGILYYNQLKRISINKNDGTPYLIRWFIIPKNKYFNIYLHKFMSSDEDRALHDHPWIFNISILLNGRYIEHLPFNITKTRYPFIPILRGKDSVHRIQLFKDKNGIEKPIWTIFITGKIIKDWGFYCKNGWIAHDSFLKDKSICE